VITPEATFSTAEGAQKRNRDFRSDSGAGSDEGAEGRIKEMYLRRLLKNIACRRQYVKYSKIYLCRQDREKHILVIVYAVCNRI